MAFVSMMIVWIVIAAIILGLMTIAGLALLIVGIVRRSKPKNKGRKSPVVCIVTGIILLMLPVITSLVLAVWGLSSTAETALKRTGYECVPDRWRNEWVYDSDAEEEIIEALLNSAENGDRQAFSRNFTPELQRKEGFDDAVNAFFAAYPKGFANCERKDKNGGGSGSYNYGHNVRTDSVHFNTTLDGNWYYVSIEFCYENTDEPDKVGVTDFRIMNLEAAAVFFDEYSRSMEVPDDTYLLCGIKSSDEISARLIAGQPFLWTPTDTPKLSAEELRDLLQQNRQLDSEELRQKLGTPNAFRKYSNSNAYEYYYELKDRNGHPCYANLETEFPHGEVFRGFLCTPEDFDFDFTLYDYESSR